MLDFIIVAVFVFCVFFGWRRGFVKIVIRFFGMLLSVLIAFFSYGFVADWLAKTSFGASVTAVINNMLRTGGGEALVRIVSPATDLVSALGEAVGEELELIVGQLSLTISSAMLSAISLLLVFFIAFIIIRVAEIILCMIFSLPVVRMFNRIGGFGLGIVIGYIWAYIINFSFIVMMPFSVYATSCVENSFLSKILFVNPLKFFM